MFKPSTCPENRDRYRLRIPKDAMASSAIDQRLPRTPPTDGATVHSSRKPVPGTDLTSATPGVR